MKSLRVGLAVLLVLIVLWIKGDLDRIQSNWPGPTEPAAGQMMAPAASSRPIASGGNPPATGDKPDRVIVVGKMKHDDTDWVVDELPDWQHAIYTVNDPTAALTVSKNKGKESAVYLQYLIDHYHALPSLLVFLHAHRDGYPRAWHTEFAEHSNVRTVQMLQSDFVLRSGYANLRCTHSPGCPDEIRPFRDQGPGPDDSRPQEPAFAIAWREMFNTSLVPEVIAAPCCSQFAVSRDQVLKRPLSDYERFRRWVFDTDLEDDISGRVMEYMWHVIFGRDPVYCPPLDQCYHDVYGVQSWGL